jgi:hypothetical protein
MVLQRVCWGLLQSTNNQGLKWAQDALLGWVGLMTVACLSLSLSLDRALTLTLSLVITTLCYHDEAAVATASQKESSIRTYN